MEKHVSATVSGRWRWRRGARNGECRFERSMPWMSVDELGAELRSMSYSTRGEEEVEGGASLDMMDVADELPLE